MTSGRRAPLRRFLSTSARHLRIARYEGLTAVADQVRDRWRDSQWRVTLTPRAPGDPIEAPVLNLAGVPAAARFGEVARALIARLRAESRERAVAVLAPDRGALALDWWTSEARFGERFVRDWPGDAGVPDHRWLSAVHRARDLTDARIVHVEDLAGLSLPSLVELARTGPPMVVGLQRLPPGRPPAAHQRWMDELFSRAAAIVCPTAFVRDRALSAHAGIDPARVVLIPPGLPAPVFEERPARDRRQVAVVGGLSEAAGGALAAQAAIEIAARGCDVTIYGPIAHDDGPRHLAAIGPRAGIRIRGRCAVGELPYELARQRAIVALVLPSAPPAFSLELSDAWSARVPVVATDTGALAERLAMGGGRLVPPDATPDDVADAVDALRASPPPVPRPPTDIDAATAHTALYLACASSRPQLT